MNDLLIKLLQEEEGLTLDAIPDNKGYWEIGWGHDLPFNVVGYKHLVWTREQADTQLPLDASKALAFASELPGFYSCNSIQQAALGSMCYQLGSLAAWPKLKASLALKDYAGAAREGLITGDGITSSDWVKQTPRRAYREALMLATGIWIPKL